MLQELPRPAPSVTSIEAAWATPAVLGNLCCGGCPATSRVSFHETPGADSLAPSCDNRTCLQKPPVVPRNHRRSCLSLGVAVRGGGLVDKEGHQLQPLGWSSACRFTDGKLRFRTTKSLHSHPTRGLAAESRLTVKFSIWTFP